MDRELTGQTTIINVGVSVSFHHTKLRFDSKSGYEEWLRSDCLSDQTLEVDVFIYDFIPDCPSGSDGLKKVYRHYLPTYKYKWTKGSTDHRTKGGQYQTTRKEASTLDGWGCRVENRVVRCGASSNSSPVTRTTYRSIEKWVVKKGLGEEHLKILIVMF